MLGDGRAALDPVAGIDVAEPAESEDAGVVDMAADHAVGADAPGLVAERLLEGADIFYGVLDFLLEPGRQRPEAEAEAAAEVVEHGVENQGQLVGAFAEEGEPARVANDGVELVAMDDQEAAAVGGQVDDLVDDFDAAEMGAEIVAQELVVIAGNVDDARPLACLAEKLLDHVVVLLRPVPAAPQAPAVDDVADQIDRFGIVIAQEIEKQARLAPLGAEMDVGEEKRPEVMKNGPIEHHRRVSAGSGHLASI